MLGYKKLIAKLLIQYKQKVELKWLKYYIYKKIIIRTW